MELPKPKLGDITALTITTTDLEVSLGFYQKLGFSEVMRDTFPFPWIQITDGALLIMLRKDKEPYIALTYYPKAAAPIVAELEEQGIPLVFRPKPTDMIKRFVMESPDGMKVSLVEIPDGFKQPTGPTMLTTAPQDYFNPEKYVNKVCGMFGELAHPVKDLEASIAFWEKLGFAALSRFTSPYPWAILSDGLAIVGVHQTNHFSHPAITFFAADMKEKIAKLKEHGIATEATDGQANITISTPEQQRINLFKMGM
jgi:catechol 2,3-dioxygenase-like lactoylglutathione lyase family enzyme